MKTQNNAVLVRYPVRIPRPNETTGVEFSLNMPAGSIPVDVISPGPIAVSLLAVVDETQPKELKPFLVIEVDRVLPDGKTLLHIGSFRDGERLFALFEIEN